jgi:hypothetical protein
LVQLLEKKLLALASGIVGLKLPASMKESGAKLKAKPE